MTKVKGLETIRTEAKTRFGWVPHPTHITTESTRELVDKSQAEAMIAEERAKGEKFEKMWLDVGVENTKLKTDNAALTARVKELEKINADLCRSHGVLNVSGARLDEQVKALETRLAKMREGLLSIARQWPDTSAAKTARAALEAKP